MKKGRLSALFIIILLLISMSIMTPLPIVLADGSASVQEVSAEFTMIVSPPAYDGSADSRVNLEDDFRGAPLNITDLQGLGFDLEIYQTTAKMKGTGTGGQLMKMAIYEYVAWDNGGELRGESGTVAITDGIVTKTFTFSTPVSIPSDENWVFIGCLADGGAGTIEIDTDSEAGAMRIYDTGMVYPNFDDPLAGESGGNGTMYLVQVKFYADQSTTTGFNQYYGTESDYTARRDVNITFPTGSILREINFTLPIIEQITNITYSNGGFWNASLTSGEYNLIEYNATHNIIQIEETEIASYGGNFRVFSETYDYYGTLAGPFYENGTAYPSSVSVTMVSGNGTETIVVDGSEQDWGSDDQVYMFYWSLQSGGVRRVYIDDPGETITVFMPEANYATYEFDIRDYTGRLDDESFLEAWRVVNSTEALIERSSIIDAVNEVPLSLVQYAVYNLRVVFGDGTTYVFGYLVTGVDPTPTISIQEIEWGNQAHTTYTHITVEATRPTPTSILTSYLDETPGSFTTSWVNLTITYRNGTSVYNASQADSKTVSFSWPSANATLDYVVRVTATHSYYGTIYGVWVLDASRSFSAFPDLDALGTWGFDTTNLLAFGVSLIVALCFTFAGRWLAPFAFMSTVGAFTYLGATDLSSTQVGIGFVLAIVMGAVLGGRQT